MSPRRVRIESDNSDFQYVETLRRNRTKRHRHRAFFVEGVRAINALVASDWMIQGLYYAPDRGPSDWARRILANARTAAVFELTSPLMARLSEREETSELIAVVEMKADDIRRIPDEEPRLVVLLDRPSSPGNLGTIIRSCDALGVQGILVTGHASDLYDPETIRATAGSMFALPVVRLPSHREVLQWANALRARTPPLRIVGTSAHAPTRIDQHDFSAPTLLCLGNEKWGLSKNYQAACDALVTIPLGASRVATSLNVACATTAVLAEIQRQRWTQTTYRASHRG